MKTMINVLLIAVTCLAITPTSVFKFNGNLNDSCKNRTVTTTDAINYVNGKFGQACSTLAWNIEGEIQDYSMSVWIKFSKRTIITLGIIQFQCFDDSLFVIDQSFKAYTFDGVEVKLITTPTGWSHIVVSNTERFGNYNKFRKRVWLNGSLIYDENSREHTRYGLFFFSTITDELRIYEEEITQAQVDALFEPPVSTTISRLPYVAKQEIKKEHFNLMGQVMKHPKLHLERRYP